jgi:hypothetical protein
MKRYLLIASVLAVVAVLCLAAGVLDRRIARAQQDFAAFKYDEPAAELAKIERYLEYGSRLPWIGSSPLNGVRARKAAAEYWQRRYDLVIPQQDDPIAAVSPDNLELQFIVADAVYRAGQPRAVDRTTTLRALDAAINAYVAVLKNDRWHEGAAFNYEYLVRVRADIDKGRRPPKLSDAGDNSPSGRQGGPPPEDSNNRKFKILVPLDSDEMQKATDPGKGTLIERKG